MQRKEKALQLFSNRCNCSQAVFAAFRQAEVLDEVSALRLATVFGGGVAGSGVDPQWPVSCHDRGMQ